jgi:hypothetical protein
MIVITGLALKGERGGSEDMTINDSHHKKEREGNKWQ